MRSFVREYGRKRAERWMERIRGFLPEGGRVLDVGCGDGMVSAALARKYAVTSLDVKSKRGVRPVLYDGKRMPFEDDAFDVALVMFVLHHSFHHQEILVEAKRVARRVVVVEDVFYGPLHKYWTFFLDSVANGEFFGHPHSNRDDAGWRGFFGKLGFRVEQCMPVSTILGWKHMIYVLERQ